MDIQSAIRTAFHVAQLMLWKTTRIALLVWGVMNGFGVVLLGQVARVKRRISRRVPRVSGPISS